MIEELTIKDIKNELVKLNNKLENRLQLKKINFEKATGTNSALKDILTSKTNFVFDKLTHYVIKDDQYDEEIYYIQKEIASYEILFYKEIERLQKYDDLSLIIYLREEENWKWFKIDKLLNYSQDYSRLKYNRYINEKNKIDTV